MRRCDGVLLEGEDLAVAAVLARIGAAHLQRVSGSLPAAAARVRDQLTAFAAETTSVLVTDGHDTANPAAAVVVADSAPAEVTAAQAAARLGISPQAVRGLCRAGVLFATRSPAGHWRIGAASVATLAARRKGA